MQHFYYLGTSVFTQIFRHNLNSTIQVIYSYIRNACFNFDNTKTSQI